MVAESSGGMSMTIKCMTCAHLNEPRKNSCCSKCIHIAKDNYEPISKKQRDENKGEIYIENNKRGGFYE